MQLIWTTVAIALLDVAAGFPLSGLERASASSLSKRAVTCPGTNQKQFAPNLRTINVSGTDPMMFHVANGTAPASQVVTFSDIPPTATNFMLQWAQSVSPPYFRATGGGTVAVYALDTAKLPAEGNLTPEAVEAAIDPTVGIPETGGRVGGAAFGGWPESPNAREHLVGQLNTDNRAEFSFSLTLTEPGEVWHLQNDANGWFLRYDC